MSDPDATIAWSGKTLGQLTIEAVMAGDVTVADLRIHPDTLEHQAEVAQAHANPQLAENFRRAAELTALDDSEVLGIYEALRPGRSSAAELRALADSLSERGATRNAALIREAAHVYERRALTR
jgi:propanediol dehydratase small subunit